MCMQRAQSVVLLGCIAWRAYPLDCCTLIPQQWQPAHAQHAADMWSGQSLFWCCLPPHPSAPPVEAITSSALWTLNHLPADCVLKPHAMQGSLCRASSQMCQMCQTHQQTTTPATADQCPMTDPEP